MKYNIITLRPLYMYNIFLYYTYVFLYHSVIVILSFSQYCQICYNLICCTIFNINLTHVMLQIVLELFFLGGHVISTSINYVFICTSPWHYLYNIFYYLCVVHNNLSVKYQLCLNKLFSVSVSV